jgi:hypothetical protein
MPDFGTLGGVECSLDRAELAGLTGAGILLNSFGACAAGMR